MKIALLALGSRYIHLSPAPFYLAAAMKGSGHSVEVLDHSVNEPIEKVLADITARKPDLLGLSVYIWNLTYLKKMLPALKKELPSVSIVLGGPEVSYNAEETLLAFPMADAVLSGEGEVPFRAYCESLAAGESPSSVLGCSYRTERGIFVAAPYVGEGTPPSPLDGGYAEALQGRIAYIESSRGCPFSCAFCLSGRCGGVRYFDLDRVKADLLVLAQNSKTVKFIDRTFNADRARAKEIISFILAHYGKEIPEKTCFHFEIAGELLDAETVALLQNAPRGLFQAEIGVQSFHPETLRAIRRSANTERLEQNVCALLKQNNVHVHIDLIAGLPNEDLATFAKSFDRAFSLHPHMLQLGFLKLLHGAPLREESSKFDCSFSAEPPYEVKSTHVLSKEDLALLHVCELGCDRVYNSGRYRRTVALWEKTCRENRLCADAETPFRLFLGLGRALRDLPKGATLGDEITAVFFAFASIGIDENALRDAMLTDLIATNSSRLMPAVLRREHPCLGRVKQELSRRFPLAKGIRRAFFITAQTQEIVFADYLERDAVTEEYPIRTLPLSSCL